MEVCEGGFWRGEGQKMVDGSEDAARNEARVAISPIAVASSSAITEPGRRLGDEIAAARSYRAQAKAANTIRAYASDWKQFEGWCDERGVDPLPARPEAVATYLAALAMDGKTDSTIGRHLAAIGWKHRQEGLVAPTVRDERMVIADTLAGIRRERDGGPDRVMYLEGSDQHRGWFQSSLLESCGTRGRAPFDIVLTHGFVLDEKGLKMSKSLKNVIAPQEVIKQSGADILRLWVGSCDYWDDQRIGPEILKTTVETYRKLRNTFRWMLGSLAHFHDGDRVPLSKMPELERYMLHRLTEIDQTVRKAYADFDYKRIFAVVSAFMTADLSAFYFDVRKDSLYCDPISEMRRKACLTVLDDLFRATVTWLAPMLCFTCEEVWLSRFGVDAPSVHRQLFHPVPAEWRDDALAEKWRKVRQVRRVVTGALEIERAAKKIGSSLEADPMIHIADADLFAAVVDVDLAEVCITSAATLIEGEGPADAFRIPEVRGVAVMVKEARGRKCARSWKILPDVGSDPRYPDVSPRDARALAEWDAERKAAE